MNQTGKTIVRIVAICVIFIPYKFILMNGRHTGFLQDLVVAAVAYAIAEGVIYLIGRNKAG